MTKKMNKSDFYYDLPEELIAQTPIEPRDASRMLVFDGKIEHKHFYDLPSYLRAGDVLVINDTRVMPARLFGYKLTGAKVEVLLIKRINYTDWEAIVRPGNKLKLDTEIVFSEELSAKIIEHLDDGGRVLRFNFKGVFEDILNRVGIIPLPPYIKEKLKDTERYQTVYNKITGSAAAPTAGLHFTQDLLKRIKDMGVIICPLLLHVGLSTFRPVKEENIEEHKMHCEYYEVSKEAADILNLAKQEKRRIIAVGTTSLRTLESVYRDGKFIADKGETDIFIYPPYEIKTIDALITNFHLPESTLLMLVSACIGLNNVKKIYKTAVEEKYRFFSFGDSSLLFLRGQNV